MPVCDDCDDFYPDETEVDEPKIHRLYRAVADGEPRREIMQMIYDMFGDCCELRPPASELNLARTCAGEGSVRLTLRCFASIARPSCRRSRLSPKASPAARRSRSSPTFSSPRAMAG